MKHFVLITNKGKDPELVRTMEIKSYLERHGTLCEIAHLNRETMEDSAPFYSTQVPENTDCCIVLGGDGTVLQAARNVMGKDIPLLGINLGTVGYLTEVDKNHVNQALDAVLNGKYSIEERMMIYGKPLVSGEEMHADYALNDIVITRRSYLQIISFNIYVDGMFLNHYQADGMIISTPTGSTGYNMSAGGPIVEPDARIMLLTPICPHTMNTRTIVLSPKKEITVEIDSERTGGRNVEASYDGIRQVRMRTGDRITIGVTDMTTKILRIGHASFLEILHEKLV